MRFQKYRDSSAESSETESSKSDEFVDFTQCEKTLLVTDLRWMDIFGFFLLGLCSGLIYTLFITLSGYQKLAIARQNLLLEPENVKRNITLGDVYPKLEDLFIHHAPKTVAKLISPFFPLWMRFVIISWAIGTTLGDLIPNLFEFEQMLTSNGTDRAFGVFLCMPSVMAITFYFTLVDVGPLVPCTTIWNSFSQWLLACLRSVIKKISRSYRGWSYIFNMFVAATLLAVMGYAETFILREIIPDVYEKNRHLAYYITVGFFTCKLIGCMLCAILARIPVFVCNLIGIGILVSISQVKAISKSLPILIPLVFVYALTVAAAVPIIYYKLRLNDNFNPSEKQFLFGIVCFFNAAGSGLGFFIQKLIKAELSENL